jgi:Flp pilus assembly protein TadG
MMARKRFMVGEHGTALLETALSATLLLGMIFGVMAGGFMLYTYHFLSYATRVGARYASVRGSACDNSNGMPDCPGVTSAQVQTYVRGLHQLGISPTQLTVTATWPKGTNNPGDTVQVTAQYPFPLSVPFVTSKTVNMQSTAQMLISQ